MTGLGPEEPSPSEVTSSEELFHGGRGRPVVELSSLPVSETFGLPPVVCWLAEVVLPGLTDVDGEIFGAELDGLTGAFVVTPLDVAPPEVEPPGEASSVDAASPQATTNHAAPKLK